MHNPESHFPEFHSTSRGHFVPLWCHSKSSKRSLLLPPSSKSTFQIEWISAWIFVTGGFKSTLSLLLTFALRGFIHKSGVALEAVQNKVLKYVLLVNFITIRIISGIPFFFWRSCDSILDLIILYTSIGNMLNAVKWTKQCLITACVLVQTHSSFLAPIRVYLQMLYLKCLHVKAAFYSTISQY